ncbi:MAG: DUF4358 domain-containing protein [Clostridia bacterium]|nr:DUF4358 domain-containing protein [Clostridia bacterium]
MKKLLSAFLSMALILSLSAAAFAAGSAYAGTVTINGTKLDLSKTPASSLANALPMRAVVEADYGYAAYYPEEGRSFFSLDGVSIYVTLATGAVELNGKEVSGMKAELKNGVTFLSADVLKGVSGYTVAAKGKDITLTTPNSDPLVKLARSIIKDAGMASGMKQGADEMEQYYGIKKDTFTSVVGFFPMMINADTVVIGKVASGKLDDAKKQLEAQKQTTIKNFEQYLPGPLEMAKKGQVVTSGDYIMLIISPDNDKAIQMFKDGVK